MPVALAGSLSIVPHEPAVSVDRHFDSLPRQKTTFTTAPLAAAAHKKNTAEIESL
jgi:hypothetical protein